MTTKLPNDPYEEGSNNVVIGIIGEFRKELAEYEANSTQDRAAFKASIEASLVQLRKDFNRALQPIMLETLDSRESRRDLLKSLNDDYATRTQRQAEVDRRFTILTIIVVIVAVLILVAFTVLIVRLLIMNR